MLSQYLRDVESGGLSEDEQLPVNDSVRTDGSPVLANLTGTTAARSILEAMITHSDDTATDVALPRVGPDRVRSLIPAQGLARWTRRERHDGSISCDHGPCIGRRRRCRGRSGARVAAAVHRADHLRHQPRWNGVVRHHRELINGVDFQPGSLAPPARAAGAACNEALPLFCG
jgi:hypothetical protein